LEKLLLIPYNYNKVGTIIGGLADAWAAWFLIDYSNLYSGEQYFWPKIFLAAFSYRTVCHVILLKQGLLRIIDLDVEDYKAKGR